MNLIQKAVCCIGDCVDALTKAGGLPPFSAIMVRWQFGSSGGPYPRWSVYVPWGEDFSSNQDFAVKLRGEDDPDASCGGDMVVETQDERLGGDALHKALMEEFERVRPALER